MYNDGWRWFIVVNYQGGQKGNKTILPPMGEHGEYGPVLTNVSSAGLLAGAGT